jgi:hypothetical protein
VQKQGVRVDMLQAPATVRATRIDRDVTESRPIPAGTAVISTRQPVGGLANPLLEKAPAFSKGGSAIAFRTAWVEGHFIDAGDDADDPVISGLLLACIGRTAGERADVHHRRLVIGNGHPGGWNGFLCH